MLGAEAASFEITTAFAGFLGPAPVAAHAGVFSIVSLCYIAMPFAISIAATIRWDACYSSAVAVLASRYSYLVVDCCSTVTAAITIVHQESLMLLLEGHCVHLSVTCNVWLLIILTPPRLMYSTQPFHLPRASLQHVDANQPLAVCVL